MSNSGNEVIDLLLVEDDEDFSMALESRLLKRHFIVTRAVSAEEGLEKVRSGNFKVVLVDIKLPGMDGIKFLEKIREINKDIPVILITGYASLESATEAVKLNASDYLLKPLENIEELLNPVYKAVRSYELVVENRKLYEELKENVRALEASYAVSREQQKALEEKNITLKEILSQLEVEKRRLQDNVVANSEKIFLPTLKKLKKTADPRSARQIEILEKNLEDLTSSFGKKIMESSNNALTSKEIEICNMIKNGLTSKEISKILNIALQTVERHRNNIRKKLDIVKKDINLASYLQTL